MNDSPLISVIIPNYNTDKYLEETILSVIAQSYKNWELLIIDDHSSDNSVEIIKKYATQNEKVKYLQTPANSGGPSTPRNIGLDHAKGEYMAFLDSDDTWFTKKLEFQLKLMKDNNSKFSSTFRNTFHKPEEMMSEVPKTTKLIWYNYNKLLKKNFIDTSAVVIHKDLIGDIRFDTAKELVAIEDYDFWLKVLKAHNENILVSNSETINYRITGMNISQSKIKMAKKFIRVLKKHNESLLSITYHFFTYAILSLIYSYTAKKR